VNEKGSINTSKYKVLIKHDSQTNHSIEPEENKLIKQTNMK